jgi:hypothetical protein
MWMRWRLAKQSEGLAAEQMKEFVHPLVTDVCLRNDGLRTLWAVFSQSSVNASVAK